MEIFPQRVNMTGGYSARQGHMDGVTELLTRWQSGEADAGEKLLASLYSEMRQIAGRQFAGERANHTLQPTALVHEAYERLISLNRISWTDRAHFLAMAARVMREVLIDHARKRGAAKRDWGRRVTLTGQLMPDSDQPLDLLDLDEVLKQLEDIDPMRARVVELRYFGGLTIEETASVIDQSPATVKRHWQVARAWLYQALRSP